MSSDLCIRGLFGGEVCTAIVRKKIAERSSPFFALRLRLLGILSPVL